MPYHCIETGKEVGDLGAFVIHSYFCKGCNPILWSMENNLNSLYMQLFRHFMKKFGLEGPLKRPDHQRILEAIDNVGKKGSLPEDFIVDFTSFEVE